MTHRSLADRQRDFTTVTRGGFCWQELNTQADKAAVLLHGVTGGKDDLLPLAERYAALGYAVYCVDLVGHGGSAMIHVTEFDDLGRWMDRLIREIGVTPTILMGNSYSSAVVYNYMQLGLLPDATHVILGCPTPFITWLPAFMERLNQRAPNRVAWYLYNVPPAQRIRVRVAYRGADRQSYDWLVESEKRKHKYIAANVPPILNRILMSQNPFRGRTLPEELQRRITVVIGDRDNVIPRAGRQHLARILPHATFIDADHAGHILHFEALDDMVHDKSAA